MKMFLISLEIKCFTAFDVSDTQVELVGRWKLSRFGKFCSRFACVFDVLSTNIQLFMPNKNYFACLLLKPFYPVSKLTLFAFESVQSIQKPTSDSAPHAAHEKQTIHCVVDFRVGKMWYFSYQT